MEIITPRCAIALKTDVHLSVIYSTRPVRADKVNLACQAPLLALDCSPGHLRIPEWLDDAACPRMHHDSPLSLHLCLRSGRENFFFVCVLKCVIAMNKRPLMSSLGQPLAEPGSFLKCPRCLPFDLRCFKATSPYLGVNNYFELTGVFGNHLMVPFTWEGGSNLQRQ